MGQKSKTPIIIISIGICAVLYFVWPTQYRYDHTNFGDSGTSYLVRTERLTGETEVLLPTGWAHFRSSEPDQDLPPDQLAKLHPRLSIDSSNDLNGSLYNGSTWSVSQIGIELVVKNPTEQERVRHNQEVEALRKLVKENPDMPDTDLFQTALSDPIWGLNVQRPINRFGRDKTFRAFQEWVDYYKFPVPQNENFEEWGTEVVSGGKTEALRRTYNFNTGEIQPSTTGTGITEALGFSLRPWQTWSFTLMSAKGHLAK